MYEEVEHPAHYNHGWIEHCEVVEDQGWADGYYPAQVSKYLYRAGRKPGVSAEIDLQKAKWYLDRWIAWRQHGRAIWKITQK